MAENENEVAKTSLTRNNNEFVVVSLKRIKTGGLDLGFVEHVDAGGSCENYDWKLTCPDVPHPDLISGLYDLKQYLANCYGMLDIRTVMSAKGLQAGAKASFKTVSPHLEAMLKARLGKLDVTGYKVSGSIKGEKDKRAVIITGTFEQEDGTKTALNSPLIKFDKKTFNFEDDVKVIIDDLEDEVREYIKGTKRAQQTMFGVVDSKQLEVV